MREIRIVGGRPLQGEIRVQGSKNAVLPMLAGALLNRGQTVLHGCPGIADVAAMLSVLERLGCRVDRERDTVVIDAKELRDCRVTGEDAGKMRSSVLLMGGLLGRMGQARIAYPGGCVIGKRPIDIHLCGLSEMGVSIKKEPEGINAQGRPKGGTIRLAFPSVGATENLLLAAAGASEITVLDGCAKEPEIVALCEFLQCMGAEIYGGGTARIVIRPPKRLESAEYRVPGDRIVAGTYALAAVSTGGSLTIEGVDRAGWRGQLYPLQLLGAKVLWKEDRAALGIQAPKRPAGIPFLDTAPYPGFPTDLQSQMLAVLAGADGISCLQETIFEQRFKVIDQLRKMGAQIEQAGNLAVIEGTSPLRGTLLEARELRGGAALVTAALGAEGESRIRGVEFIERGYENICRDLQQLGGQIEMRKG